MRIYIFTGLIFLFLTSCRKDTGTDIDQIESNISDIDDFGLYRVEGDTFILLPNGDIDLSKTNVILAPILGLDEINYFDQTCQTLHLNQSIGWNDIPAYNAPFLIAEAATVIGKGYFYNWPNCCWPRGFGDEISLTLHSDQNPLLTCTMQLHGRNGDVLVDALPDSLVRSNLSLHIDSASLIYDEEKIVAGKFVISLINTSQEPLLLIDPGKVPQGVRISDWKLTDDNYIPISALTPEYSVRDRENMAVLGWSEDWYISLQPGEQVQRSYYSNAVSQITEVDSREILLIIDNHAGAISKERYNDLPVKPFIGTIQHVQEVQFQ